MTAHRSALPRECEAVAPPLPREALEEELAALRPLAVAARGGYRLYSFRAAEAPSLMYETGRLREAAFRGSGGGTGRAVDIDADDTAPEGYRQIVAWDPLRREIAGGYRYIICGECDAANISSSHYFRFSDRFCREYLPRAVELGRSFVAGGGARGQGSHPLFAMESLWRGLGRVVASRPEVRYLFGKVTVYPHYDAEARRLLMTFLHTFFGSDAPLLQVFEPAETPLAEGVFDAPTYAENYGRLLRLLRARGEGIPPMIHAYMRLCPSMRVFDTAVNRDFGDAYETAVLLPVGGIRADKRRKYLEKTSVAP